MLQETVRIKCMYKGVAIVTLLCYNKTLREDGPSHRPLRIGVAQKGDARGALEFRDAPDY